jgi:type IV pilus assembly protein PilA
VFRAFHEKRKNEEGFTLIELLVVILIIAILAAIAIPVFLNQRRKGWISQSESALKNAATAEESYATANNGDYTSTEADLVAEGYSSVAGVTINATATTSGYCISAIHDQSIPTYFYDSDVGRPRTNACT